jgi:hypothetical protein
MWILIDQRSPAEAKEQLALHGSVVEFSTGGLVYDAISGHPDIFFCQSPAALIAAPNTPRLYSDWLKEIGVEFITGEKPVQGHYPETAHYNAVVTEELIIHKRDVTDTAIIKLNSTQKFIHVNQAYTRCNLLALKHNHFITSDEGISKALQAEGCTVLCTKAGDVLLPGFEHGFFGGACGVHENRLFINGSLKHYSDEKVKAFLTELHYEIIELYDGPLFDGGGIMIID